MQIDIQDLLNRAMNNDPLASLELLRLQREGRALRLYPNGRKGPLEDGMSPIVFGRNSETGLIRIERLRTGRIEFKFEDVGRMAMHQMHLCSLLYMDYEECESPLMEIESHADCDLKTMSWMTDDAIMVQFIPDAPAIEYGIDGARNMMAQWVHLIEDTERDYSDFGFDNDEWFYNLMDFTSSPMGTF